MARALVAGALLVALRVPAHAASVNEPENNGTPATGDSLTATQFGVGAIGSVVDVEAHRGGRLRPDLHLRRHPGLAGNGSTGPKIR